MKKIVVAIMALTLCVMHDCSAMLNPIRQNIGRFGQYARQYAQQAAPTCRSFASRVNPSNLKKPQNFGWLRNMQTCARNVNLPSMRTAALGLGGAGLGAAAYLQRPELFARVNAEEQKEHNILDEIELKLKNSALNKSAFSEIADIELTKLKIKLRELTFNGRIADRKKFTSVVNGLLNLRNRDLYEELQLNTKGAGSFKMGALILLAQAINGDITLANAVHDLADVPDSGDPTVKLEIPDIYKIFFHEISKNNELKQYFMNAIDKLNQPTPIHEIIENDDSDLSDEAKVLRDTRRFQNQRKILKQISNILEGKSSSWWWPF